MDDERYRPHLVVGDPCQWVPRDGEEYLGVQFGRTGVVLAPGPAHRVLLSPLYSPSVDCRPLVAGATFTVREGPHIVGFGVVSPPAIYADFNGMERSTHDTTLAAIHLHRMGSLKDLARFGIVLSEGMELAIYSDSDENHDLEATAVARFDPGRGQWLAEFDAAQIRNVPVHPKWSGDDFPCVVCRANLAPMIAAHGLQLGDACQHCGTPVHRVLGTPLT